MKIHYTLFFILIISFSDSFAQTWNVQQQGISKGFVREMYFIDANTGYAVGTGNLIFKNTNGGGQIGIHDFASISKIKIYPNPATSSIQLECPFNNKQIEVSIFSISGIEVGKYQLTESLQSLNISNFPSGLYIVRTDDGINRSTGKFVKY